VEFLFPNLESFDFLLWLLGYHFRTTFLSPIALPLSCLALLTSFAHLCLMEVKRKRQRFITFLKNKQHCKTDNAVPFFLKKTNNAIHTSFFEKQTASL